jgi:diguanylate cyclase (GGDEF)-like protein
LAVREGGSAEGTVYLMAAAILMGLSVLETSYAMAYRDDLTGLPARRALMRDLHGLGATYTLAMVDVDHFKKFNDRHGHDVGDQVLKMVAGQLAQTPGGGRAYRYGGEEFTLVFPGKTRDEAVPHLDAVRVAVGDARFNLRSWARPRKKPQSPKGAKQDGRTLSVTVSIGVADSSTKEPTTEKVLKKADQALYRAKKAGRNQVSK